MSELISGKDALIALANGEAVEYQEISRPFNDLGWCDAKGVSVHLFLKDDGLRLFRLKPRTITLDGIGVPAPFEPKIGEFYYCVSPFNSNGYTKYRKEDYYGYDQFGAWRTEEEIKQIVAALRNVFKGV